MAKSTFILSLTLILSSSVQLCFCDHFLPQCDSLIHCTGDLLDTVQLSQVYNESKLFVDMSIKPEFDPQVVYENFLALSFTGDVSDDPEKMAALVEFINLHFEEGVGSEFIDFTFSDWDPNPAFLNLIVDENYTVWAAELHAIWNNLGRKIRDDLNGSDLTSIVYSEHPVVVPGGRFRELFYWDSYWIIRGLLISGMADTVEGMILNFVDLVKEFGYVPNGGRAYFLHRTQPPLLLPMVKSYMDATGKMSFLQEIIPSLEKEFDFFLTNRNQTVEKDGVQYMMAKYYVERTGPRPEQYLKETRLIESLPEGTDTEAVYSHLKAGCESGWDFSSRWFVVEEGDPGPANLTHTKTADIIPVDLNAFLYGNAVLLQEFCGDLEEFVGQQVCDHTPDYYGGIASNFKTGIKELLWDETDGSWYDYNYVRQESTRAFYASNLIPLWTNADHRDEDPALVGKVLEYLNNSGALGHPGGLPTSLVESGEQWDFPNAWAPLVHMTVEALDNTQHLDAIRLAFDLATNWTQTNYLAWTQYNETEGGMFEKYDVTKKGCPGSGGMYATVLGFGWTNGVILDFLTKYNFMASPLVPESIDCS